MPVKKIAIACQGGGTHAAFTWGVLTEILETKKAWDAEPGDGPRFEISAISGTSAGALCALATWYGLAPNTADPGCGAVDKAIERLNFLWTTFAATTPIEAWLNMTMGKLLEMKEKGVPLPTSNPYGPAGEMALTGLSMLGARPEFISFPALLDALCPGFAEVDWSALATANRRMIAGAIEVFSGNFEIFDSNKTLEEKGLRPAYARYNQYEMLRWRMRRTLSLEGVAASGTLPELLRAQKIENLVFPTGTPGETITRDGYYWDGLYSQNPPVSQFLEACDNEEKPDEIWVVRINPQEIDYEVRYYSLEDIRDRENDLAGNLSLNQELDHIVLVNKLITKHRDKNPYFADLKLVDVRTIKMERETVWNLQRTSKFDRHPDHLERLRAEGQAVAKKWLAGWRAKGEDFQSYPIDAHYPDIG